MQQNTEMNLLKEIDSVVNQANAVPQKKFYNFTPLEWEKGIFALVDKYGSVTTSILQKRLSPCEQEVLADKINAKLKSNGDLRRLVLQNWRTGRLFDKDYQSTSYWSFKSDFISFKNSKSFELACYS